MTFGSKIIDSGKKRVIGLDILRSIAILLVMYEHSNSLLPGKLVPYLSLPRPSIDGVSIFFVLSGFLIGGILLHIISTSHFTPKDILNFWLRRWLRTIPNYYFILIVLVICQLVLDKDIGHVDFKYFIFSQNLYQQHPLFFPEAWSLSIEEWFYLLFPIFIFIFFVFLKDKKKSVIIAAIIFLTIPLVLRIVKYHVTGSTDWDLDYRKIIILRLDSLMYGILGAYISIYGKNLWKKMKNAGIIISGLIVLFLLLYSGLATDKPMFMAIYHFNLESLAVFFALPYFSQLQSIKYKRAATIFTFISLISYSMYLINLTLIREIAIPHILKLIGLGYGMSILPTILFYIVQFFLYWFLTIFISYYMYRYIEVPVMNFRDRVRIK